MDLAGFTIPELESLRARVDAAIRAKRDAVKRQLREKMEKLAAEEGLTLSDVLATAPPARQTRAKAKPKYANPANPAEVWAGRGKQPAWVKRALAEGRTLADLAI
ncbi:MAG: transcriptional regulator [Proteobacteria bacterium]|nr:MAG: transcriptional regulator [Pseudomonadota bacterium]